MNKLIQLSIDHGFDAQIKFDCVMVFDGLAWCDASHWNRLEVANFLGYEPEQI